MIPHMIYIFQYILVKPSVVNEIAIDVTYSKVQMLSNNL